MPKELGKEKLDEFDKTLREGYIDRQKKRLSKSIEEIDMFDLYDLSNNLMIHNRDFLLSEIVALRETNEKLEKRIKKLEGKLL